ncbi:BamA/TamA family outer membrane protein [Hymenobacter sp. B1770]|uniref:BamA/TamA family outer membrane protein n=1 Tax=Hymenobacter sp. B1770 TaxID=1718788 RepID=UPI003CFB2A6C
MMQRLILICLLGLLGQNGRAQTATPADSGRVRRVGVLPVPTFGYTPETKGYLGAVALFTLRLYPDDTLTRTSNAKLEANFTQNRQRILATEWTFFSRQECYLTQGAVSLQRFPELFWGIGNRTPAANEELFDTRRTEARVAVLRQVRRYVFAGPRLQLQELRGLGLLPDGLLARGDIAGSRGGRSSGAGYELVYDGRDNLLNPQRRGYARLAHSFFGGWLGSDFRFTRYELDLRRYWRLKSRVLLAGQLVGAFHSGEPPFRMLALMGPEAGMRGYYTGRFRDRQLLAAQAEVRVPLIWRLGVVGFAGAGQVARGFGGFGLGELKPTLGGGLRFLVDKRENVNLRFDYAVGAGGNTGFYVAFGEAF